MAWTVRKIGQQSGAYPMMRTQSRVGFKNSYWIISKKK